MARLIAKDNFHFQPGKALPLGVVVAASAERRVFAVVYGALPRRRYAV